MLWLWLWLWLSLLYLIASAPVAIERKKAAMKNKHLKISPNIRFIYFGCANCGINKRKISSMMVKLT